MISPSSVRSGARRGSRRLLAVCTTGVLAAGAALALGPAGLAHADTGASHDKVSVTAPHTMAQTYKAPARQRVTKNAITREQPSGTQLTSPRYDQDGDGAEDLLVQDGNTVGVLSTLTEQVTTLGVSPNAFRQIITPGDLIKDSTGPEVLGLTASGHLQMFSTKGIATDTPLWQGTGWQIFNDIVAVGDITGDGYGDLLARTPNGDLWMYKSTGNAANPFAGRVKVGHGFGIFDQMIGAGDITASGQETLVARDLNGGLWMYLLDGNAAQQLTPRVQIGKGWNVYNQLIGLGDEPGAVGGILGRTASGDLFYYEGDGGTGTDLLSGKSAAGSQWNDHVISDQGHTVVWGKNNLFGLTSSGTLYYYYGSNLGTVSARKMVGDPGSWAGAKLVAGVSFTDEDEWPLFDIYDGTLYDDSNGTAVSGGWGGYNKVFGPGDLNGDGRSDMLARDKSGVLWMLPGKGLDKFGARIRVGGGWGGYNQLTGAGDIDGDGIADIVARNSSGTLYLYRGTGVGSAPFKSKNTIGSGWNIFSKLASPGDLDGDGRADIVAVTPKGQLYRYSATGKTGSATFKGRVEIGASAWQTYSTLI